MIWHVRLFETEAWANIAWVIWNVIKTEFPKSRGVLRPRDSVLGKVDFTTHMILLCESFSNPWSVEAFMLRAWSLEHMPRFRCLYLTHQVATRSIDHLPYHSSSTSFKLSKKFYVWIKMNSALSKKIAFISALKLKNLQLASSVNICNSQNKSTWTRIFTNQSLSSLYLKSSDTHLMIWRCGSMCSAAANVCQIVLRYFPDHLRYYDFIVNTTRSSVTQLDTQVAGFVRLWCLSCQIIRWLQKYFTEIRMSYLQ